MCIFWIIPSCARVYVHGWKTDASCRTRTKTQGEYPHGRKIVRFCFCHIAGYGILYHERNAGDRFAVRQMEQKSDFERDKIRADQLMEKEKYLAAIYRYKHLLDEADMKETSEVLRGNLWHNLGTAYARLFLFEEAGRCFEKAYALNKQKESLRECLMCCRCRHDEEAFAEIAKDIRWRRESSRKSEMKFPSHVRAKNSNSLNPIWKN